MPQKSNKLRLQSVNEKSKVPTNYERTSALRRLKLFSAQDSAANAAGVPYTVIGQAGGCELAVTGLGGLLFALDLDDLRGAHEGWMPAYMDAPV